MRVDRKAFLRLTGLSFLALAGKQAIRAVTAAAQSATPQLGPVRRWAMVIDLKKCLQDSGCVRCIEACHAAHNVPDFKDRKHEVKWIWKEPFEHVFPPEGAEYTLAAFRGAPLPVFCNHCDEPPCVRVCPTQATWRRADGIVMMDWHRCIGCRYCVAACPYGSRSFNWLDPRPRIGRLTTDFPTRTRGVVEKCNLCEERLAQGQAPACVAACKEKAMVFGDLEDPDSDVRSLLRTRYAIRRRPELGTRPQIYYLV
jgi:molybdopterin-containing oxidoreductase family iron-sulfur binding subunit